MGARVRPFYWIPIVDIGADFVDVGLWTDQTEESKIDLIFALDFTFGLMIPCVSFGKNMSIIMV